MDGLNSDNYLLLRWSSRLLRHHYDLSANKTTEARLQAKVHNKIGRSSRSWRRHRSFSDSHDIHGLKHFVDVFCLSARMERASFLFIFQKYWSNSWSLKVQSITIIISRGNPMPKSSGVNETIPFIRKPMHFLHMFHSRQVKTKLPQSSRWQSEKLVLWLRKKHQCN